MRPSGRLALRMAGGASVRLDAADPMSVSPRRRWSSVTRGGVYVDTGRASRWPQRSSDPHDGRPFPGPRHQFEVRAEDRSRDTAPVREGSVRLDRWRRLGAHGHRPRADRTPVTAASTMVRTAAYGPEWDWF